MYNALLRYEAFLAELADERLCVDDFYAVRLSMQVHMDIEIDKQARILWGGVNYDDWDDFNYWEEKELTIPWKGNGD